MKKKTVLLGISSAPPISLARFIRVKMQKFDDDVYVTHMPFATYWTFIWRFPMSLFC